MNVLIRFFVCFVCFQLSSSDGATYSAGIVENLHTTGQDLNNYLNLIKSAGKNNVDILLLPPQRSAQQSSELCAPNNYDENVDILLLPPQRSAQQSSELCAPNNYDETIKSLSRAAKEADIYVAAQLLDRVKCENDYELFDSSVVFDRNGGIVSVFRNPIIGVSKCNSTAEKTVTFDTDFGVQFSHFSARDIALRNPEDLVNGARNVIASGGWKSELPFFTSSFLSSWSKSVGANLLTDSGIYSGKDVKSVPVDSITRILVAKLTKLPGSDLSHVTPVGSTQRQRNHHEDLSQYTIRPLNLQDSSSGNKETVCHGTFCCQFYVKTNGSQSGDLSSYSLVAFSGVRQFGSRHRIGVQTCAVIGCAGLYKRSCVVRSSNGTSNLIFESIVVKGNFSSHNSAQYPTALTSTVTPPENKALTFDTSAVKDANRVTVKLEKSASLLTFGIFGREFGKDFETLPQKGLTNDSNIYDYIFNDEMSDFVDYVWIRLRILLVVVSIYVLEMM